MANFSTRFKELRIEKGLTQEELRRSFNKKYFRNFTAAAISQYENNKRVPEIEALKDFADFFKVTISYLLGESDVRDPDLIINQRASSLMDNFENLSEESKKELEKYIQLLKIKDELDKGKDEQSSTLEREA